VEQCCIIPAIISENEADKISNLLHKAKLEHP
jgi:hypothetical protein